MPDEIQPALTPEEWAAATNTVYLRDVLRDCADSAMDFEGNDFLVKAMAVANAALSDEDPRKITQHSVWIIRTLLADAHIDMQHPGAIRFRRDAEQLIAQLAALLPPNK